MAPLISHIYELGFMEALSIPQTECFKGIYFASSLLSLSLSLTHTHTHTQPVK